MLDTTTHRWLQEDPIQFKGGDPNLSRDVGNDPTNETDPTGLEEVKSVRDGGETIDPKQYGGGFTEDKEFKGKVDVSSGVKIIGKKGREGAGLFGFTYVGQNAEKAVWVQVFWEEKIVSLQRFTKQWDTNAGGKYNSSAGEIDYTTDPKKPIYFLDTSSEDDPSYGGPTYHGDGFTAFFDKPSGPVDSACKDEKNDPLVDHVTFITHYDAYLIGDKKAIYKVSWTNKTKFMKDTLGFSNTGFIRGLSIMNIEGGGPNPTMDSRQIDALKARYKDQSILP
jgi:hypothetical protein